MNDLPPAPPDRLLERLLAGERSAQRECVERHQRLVGAIVGRLVARTEEREEVCQDVFLSVFSRIGTFRGEALLSSWIGSIAFHAALNHRRRARQANLDPQGGETIDTLAGNMPTPAQTSEERDRSQRLEAELARLDPRQRTIVTLFHGCGHPYDEIARITGLPLSTVKSDLFRARRTLRERLAPQGGGE